MPLTALNTLITLPFLGVGEMGEELQVPPPRTFLEGSYVLQDTGGE